MGNHVDTNHMQTNDPSNTQQTNPCNIENDPKALEMYQTLITMGFSEKLSLEAAQSHPENVEDAMDWIINKEAIDKIMKNDDNDNNIESDNKQNALIPMASSNKNDDSDGYNAENEDEDDNGIDNKVMINNDDKRNYVENYDYTINDDDNNNYFEQNKEEEAINNNNNKQSLILRDNNSNNISEALQTADLMIKGEYNPDASPESMLIISDLINVVLSSSHNNNKYATDPKIKPFLRWANKIKDVKLNRFYYQEICNYLLIDDKRVKNLYAFHRINEVFKNVEVIEVYHTGWISLFYLELLLEILEKIHYLEYSKLHKIYLNDINNIGSLTDFEKYQNLFKHKNWNLEKGVSNLTVSRYY